MNDLYLIGNGFDLAHGLKTSYNDFLLWYLNKMVHQIVPEKIHCDNLTTVDRRNSVGSIIECESISELFEECGKNYIKIDFSHRFFEKVVKNYRDYKWVDIEYEYYMALIDLYKKFEYADASTQKQIGEDLEGLNICFELIKKNLEKYLITIKSESIRPNPNIRELLFEETGVYPLVGVELTEQEIEQTFGQSREKKLFVCFNYTMTMELYLKHSSFENNLIYIHGELDEPSNPIIFGYGDEIDPYYEKIENLNNNEFLKNIKSFRYLKTNNYQQVIRFIGSDDFTVKILGHSCGLSDRILLNTIFEHKNCQKIKIYHYEKSPIENDYFEKTQEISRHFKASKKGEMRMMIVPFNKYNKIPQNLKNN